MKILGIDPGSRACGWAILQTGDPAGLVASGVIRVAPDQKLGLRLLELETRLEEVIRTQGPALAAIERVFHGVNSQSLIMLGQARGALILTLARAGIPIEEFSPTEVKRMVTGHGRATKWQVRAMVEAQLGSGKTQSTLPLDAADAAAVAFAASLSHQQREQIERPAAFLRENARAAKELTWKRRPAG